MPSRKKIRVKHNVWSFSTKTDGFKYQVYIAYMYQNWLINT